MRMKLLFYSAVIGVVMAYLTGCSHTGGVKGISIGIDFAKGPAPTHAQVEAWRKEQGYVEVSPGKWVAGNVSRETGVEPTLINGEEVPLKDWPYVVRIFSGGSSCSASVVGPRAVLTAAHCASTGSTIQFRTVTSNRLYKAKVTRAPGYPDRDLDLALALTDEIIDVPPVAVRTDRFERKGMQVRLIGYGCVNPGGGGGNDGILRTGFSKVVAGQNYDLVLETPGGAALCYGDSGGPVFYEGDGQPVQIAVNSKGNIKDRSYTTRTTLPEGKAFLVDWANDNGTTICGVNANCMGQTPPPEGEKTFKFENDRIRIEGEIKE